MRFTPNHSQRVNRSLLPALLAAALFSGCFGGGEDDGAGAAAAWVKVEGGTYTMGDDSGTGDKNNNEWPAHEVTVNTFWMSATEVTNAQFAQYLNETTIDNLGVGKGGKKEYDFINAMSGIEGSVEDGFRAKSGKENLPVVNVSAVGAMRYAEWAGGRLPNEEEWEYAARGGKLDTPGLYSGAASNDVMDYEVGWTSMNAEAGPHKVAAMPANELGLYDMTGNVWEFCIAPVYYYPGHPMLDELHGMQVQGPALRGGSYSSSNTTVSDRSFAAAHYEVTMIDAGFRIVRDSDPGL